VHRAARQFKNDNVMMTKRSSAWPTAARREVACGPAVATSTRWSACTTTPCPTRRRGGLARGALPAPERGDARLSSRPAGCSAATPTSAEQVERYQSVGCDQLVFGLPSDSVEHEEVLEMLELFGTKSSPSSTRTRCTRRPATASRRCAIPEFNHPVPTSRSRSSHERVALVANSASAASSPAPRRRKSRRARPATGGWPRAARSRRRSG